MTFLPKHKGIELPSDDDISLERNVEDEYIAIFEYNIEERKMHSMIQKIIHEYDLTFAQAPILNGVQADHLRETYEEFIVGGKQTYFFKILNDAFVWIPKNKFSEVERVYIQKMLKV